MVQLELVSGSEIRRWTERSPFHFFTDHFLRSRLMGCYHPLSSDVDMAGKIRVTVLRCCALGRAGPAINPFAYHVLLAGLLIAKYLGLCYHFFYSANGDCSPFPSFSTSFCLLKL